MASIAELTPLIVAEWRRWPDGQMRGRDVLPFYQYLKQERPELLAFRCVGDKYQRLKAILAPHYLD